MAHLWIRVETKRGERRAPLAPTQVKRLVDGGFRVSVEMSPERVFADAEYEAAGASLVPAGSWPTAPTDAWILGLKELETSAEALRHRHVYFAHAYKDQRGWKELLGRFVAGGGRLYDLEYLTDETGRRVAAFGHWAGWIGAAVGAWMWADAAAGRGPLGALSSYENAEAMATRVREALGEGPRPRAIVVGAKGRSGRAAVEALHTVGVDDVTEWDLEETQKGGPFEEILGYDLLVNCVLVTRPVPPFITAEMLSKPRRLAAISDVSCDPGGPCNVLPIYDDVTTLHLPTRELVSGLSLLAVDHLPSLLPREASDSFSEQLLESIQGIGDSDVWKRAHKIFDDKTAAL